MSWFEEKPEVSLEFLTSLRVSYDAQIIDIVQSSLVNEGLFILGTFSEDGPDKCSGLPVQRYSEDSMSKLFHAGFSKIRCLEKRHTTPFDTIQAFLFCSFKRMVA